MHPTNFHKLYFHFYLVQNGFKFFLRPLQLMCCLEVCCFISNYLEIFKLPFVMDFYFSSIMVLKITLYYFHSLKFVKMCCITLSLVNVL